MIDKDLERRRAEAEKLKRPTPVELPNHTFRCQITVDGERQSITDPEPSVAHAKALALKAGIIEASKEAEAERKGNITLIDAIDQYIEDRRNVLSPTTLRGYKQIKEHRFKSLMSAKVRGITEADLQRAINEEAKKVSCKTIKNGVGLVVAVLSQYKAVNTKRLRLPKGRRKEHVFIEGDEIVKLICACAGDIAEVPILLAIWLGMRRSEIMGLQWESVDFERSKLFVDHAMVFDEENQIVTKDYMKNDGSMRTIDCPNYILERLKAMRPDGATGQVFHIHPNTIYKNLNKICEANGITFPGVHGLRHTNASVMLSLGIVDKIAMARGGWSSKETMERIYQHLFTSDVQEADAAINAYFESKLHTDLHTSDTAS